MSNSYIDSYSFSEKTKDHFDMVIDGSFIYNLPDSPDRWPDVGNGADFDPEDAPPIEWVPVSGTLIATQPSISRYTVAGYANDLKRGDDFPPVAAIRCPEGVIVWNGHHRATAHRLAGMELMKVRFWATIEQSVKCAIEKGD